MRIRTVKPEFFAHEGLSSCDAHARLLAIGLLCMADCAGRLRWLVPQIHGNIFPFEPDIPVKHLGKQLEQIGFLTIYEIDGKEYVQITNFTKHQRINGKEANTTSRIPPPNFEDAKAKRGSTLGSNELLPESPLEREREIGTGEREREKESQGSTHALPVSEISLTLPSLRDSERNRQQFTLWCEARSAAMHPPWNQVAWHAEEMRYKHWDEQHWFDSLLLSTARSSKGVCDSDNDFQKAKRGASQANSLDTGQSRYQDLEIPAPRSSKGIAT